MEVGPLARMVVAYASGQPDVKAAVDGVLTHLNAPATALFSTLGRIAARAIESKVMAAQSAVGGGVGRQLAHGDVQFNTAKVGPRYLAEAGAGMRMA